MVEAAESIKDCECCICFVLMVEPMTLPCNHSFCIQCLKELVSIDISKCPMCRTKFSSRIQLSVNQELQAKIKQAFPENFRKRQQEIEQIRKQEQQMVQLVFQYGNKHRLIQNAKTLKQNPNLQNKHNWTVFVKCLNKDYKTTQFIDKITIGLHESFGTTSVTRNAGDNFEFSATG